MTNLPIHLSQQYWQRILSLRRWRYRLKLLLTAALSFGLTILLAHPIAAAERVEFFIFGPVEVTLHVDDLDTFATTGAISERFAPQARLLSPEQKDSLRELLNWRFDVDEVMISQFTYSPVGDRLLRQAGQVVQTDNFLSGFSALRAAMILAAADEEGCTVINILKHFPLEVVQIDYGLLAQVLDANQRLFGDRQAAIAQIRQQAAAAANPAALANYDLSAPLNPGPHPWQVMPLTFQNPGRRQLSRADLYLPEDLATPAPVVVISHGLASDLQTFAYLAEHLASHGYGVVVLEHAETNAERFTQFLQGQAGPPDPTELLNRPRDITAVLDTLAQRAETEPMLRSLDLQTVGVWGQSLGGYTVLAAAGATIDRPQLEQVCAAPLSQRLSLNASMLLQCRITELPEASDLAVRDNRIRAVIAANPFASTIFGPTGMAQIEVPTLIVAGSEDFLTPALLEQIQPFSWLTVADAYLMVMEQGTHFSFLASGDRGALPLPDGVVGPELGESRTPMKGASLAFFDRYLRQQSEADPYLDQAYLDTLGSSPAHFSIVDAVRL